MKTKINAFLSHNSEDKPVVELIAEWLEDNANISVWLDKWNLIPGDSWQEEIEKALDESQCCTVFLGPNGMGPWQNIEMRSALNARVSENSIRVVPVLLPGAVRPGKESQLPRFLRELTWVVFKYKWNEPEALHRLVCGIEGKMPGRYEGEIQEGICPFRGLEIFREQDRQFFFGREVLVQRLLDKLDGSSFLAVTGPSGCGKSSLVQAGLIAPLRQQSQVALFTPRERPLEELAFALRTCYPKKNKPLVEQLGKRLREGGDILHLIAREILEYWEKKNLLIIIDQFEELFAQTRSEDERKRFISLILDAVDVPSGPVNVIMTIRSDFIGKCAFYRNLNMFVNDHFVQLEPMGMEELRQAIEYPARKVGLRFKDGLINRILADIKGASGELPLLEHALLELYERREGAILLTKIYDEIGGIAGALVNRAKSEFNKLDDSGKNILRKMFTLRLIQPGQGTEDTRRRATKDELLSIGGDVKEVEKILNQWINARLLTSTKDSRDQAVVDVSHEVLIRQWDKIRTWMAEDREAARLIGILRQAASEWKEAEQNPEYLFQGARLVQMEGLVDTNTDDLTKNEIEFVEAGVKMREAIVREKEEQRKKELQSVRELAVAKSKAFRRARIIILIVLIALVSLIYLSYNLNLKEKKVRLEKKEVQLQLAMNNWEKARQARDKGQHLHSFYLFEKAIKLNFDPALHKILLIDMNDYWQRFPLASIFKPEKTIKGGINDVSFTRVLTWSDDNSARIWDVKTGIQVGQSIVHNKNVSGARFNSDGTKILTWSEDGTARLWDAHSGRQIGPALVHKGWVRGALFNYDETKILTWSWDYTARIWDAKTGIQVGQSLVHNKNVYGARFNTDGTKVLTWSEDKTVRLWDANIGKQIGKALEHQEPVLGAIFNVDETKVLTRSEDKTVRLWDIKTSKQLVAPKVHEYAVGEAIFNADETRILTWSHDSTVRQWDINTTKPIELPLIHEDFLEGARFNTKRTRVLTWSEDGTARVWNAETGSQIGQPMEHERVVRLALFNADETMILTWSDDGVARLWNAKIEKNISPQRFKHNKETLMGAIFNASETKVLSWGYDKTARLWDAKTGKQIIPPLEHKDIVWGACFNSSETKILTWTYAKTAHLWDAKTGKQVGPPLEHKEILQGALFNPVKAQILTFSLDGTARLWDANTGKPIGAPMEHKYAVVSAIFNRDGTRVLSCSLDYSVRLWDANTCKQINPILLHNTSVKGARFNTDETKILTWTFGKTAQIWDAYTGKLIGIPFYHEDEINGATFNADETQILTWSKDKTVRLWDVKTGKLIAPHMVHQDEVDGAMFSNDGTQILTWGVDNVSRIWDARTGVQIGPHLEHGRGYVHSATFNADDTLILTCSEDKTARLWDTTGKQIGPSLEHGHYVNGARFNSDETRILTWDADGIAHIWDIGVDWDFPKNKIKLQMMVLTGTRFNLKNHENEIMEPDEWRKINKEYMEFAKEHYKACKYPHANVFRKLFPEEAKKIRKEE